MAALPSPPSTVRLDLLGRVFVFRRFTWREEIAFAQTNPSATRLDYVADALLSVDTKTVTPGQAREILQALPLPVRQRVAVLYLGNLPERRTLTADVPYVAPEPSRYQQVVSAEEEEIQAGEDEALERQFGADDVAASKALARRMVEGTHFAGVSRPHDAPDVTPGGDTYVDDVDEAPPIYHAVLG